MKQRSIWLFSFIGKQPTMKFANLLGGHFRPGWFNLTDTYMGAWTWAWTMRQSQGTTPTAISSFSWKIHSSEQIQQSPSGNSCMRSITTSMGHNQREGTGKPMALKTGLRQVDTGFGFLHERLQTTIRHFSLHCFGKSPIFQGIFLCQGWRSPSF